MTEQSAAERQRQEQTRRGALKCVVWDLDDTLWKGVLLEDGVVELGDEVRHVIKTLDERGVLQSIASRNEHAHALAKLEELGVAEYFLYPQISWSAKAAGIERIAAAINIGLDSIAFIDDQPFELDEVKHSLPSVTCLGAAEIERLLDMPELMPRFITEDSRVRRQMYVSDIKRRQVEAEFVGPKEEFLATLGMVFTVAPAREEDLRRAEELTVRTHQLNTTGYTYSYEELDHFRRSGRHLLLVAALEDKYGSYGKIGLALVERAADAWTIKLLLMSCRVISRGVGTVLINYIRRLARGEGVRLRAEFVPTDRNRMMYVSYKFAGFRELTRQDGLVLLEDEAPEIPPLPEYIRVQSPD
ncbi:MAG TPA: HAD-IIIC family phosphatase [Pyrinomonadaceae bacterium]|jgi:FkbH-like protein